MINGNINNSPVRSVKGKVELYEGSTLLDTYTYRDRLISFTVERVGEDSKFFGFGVCQKINLHLIDKNRELEITTAHSFKAFLTTGEEYITPFPTFYVTEVNRDENTNELSITAYDALYWASGEKINRFYITAHYLHDFITYASPSKLSSINYPTELEVFNTEYPDGANLEGTETKREVLDAIAEASQCIYFIDNTNTLTFKRLDRDGNAALTISKADYIDLDSKTNKRLAAICHATELGDNVQSSLTISGSTQYVRNNPFWELREDIGALVENALAAIGGITINQFDCSWRGNYLLEPGDKIDLITKDNAVETTYLLNDVLEYNGYLSEQSSWKYEDNSNETASNPSTLGQSLKQTYARVDKANKEITMLASDIKANADDIENISSLILDPDGIAATVSSLQKTTDESLEDISETLATLSQSVETKMTDEEVKIRISEALSNGINRVETSTGFTFDDEGLTVSKSDSAISTTITENGMKIFEGENEAKAVLIADNIGVDAKNLHATTYLIIGNNSRFEDYGSDRTGCFWIGG